MKKVLMYVSDLEAPTHASIYLAKGLRSYPNDFDVTLIDRPIVDLAARADIVMPRFEIPIDEEFLTALAQYDDGSRLFLNPPLVKRDYHSKRNLVPLLDKGILPPTCISNDPHILAQFATGIEGRVICKPIDENSGNGVRAYSVTDMEEALKVAQEYTKGGEKEAIFQSFIEGIETIGDKRVNVILYEPINTFLRLPAPGSYICNVYGGGHVVPCKFTEQDAALVEKITPYLKELGATWAGVDIIGPYLGEINLSSPGGLNFADEANENTKGLERTIELLRQW